MRQNYLYIGLAILVLIMMAGCDDDSTGMTEGDINDDAFLAGKANIDSSMTESNKDMIEAIDSLFGGGLAKVAEPDSVDYDSSEGWHIRSWIRENDFLSHSVIDSFRFADAEGNYQRHRNDETDGFERRLKRNFSYDPGGEGFTTWDKSRNRNMNWEGLTDSLVSLDGDIYRHYYADNTRRLFEHTLQGDFEEVVFETEDVLDGRPSHAIDGQFTGTFETDKVLPNREVHFAGEFTITFYPDHYHVHLVSGDNYWDWDVYYEY
ncbi:MAG: hypothetical protein GY839_00540 [candidate division Zixibacteria bacterium]|nr:hypothetical protein [candidate division Zixibacteria bacterium]